MRHTYFVTPIAKGAGLTTVSLGLLRALDKRGLRVGFSKPISQEDPRSQTPERSTHFVRATSGLSPASSIPLQQARKLVSEGRMDELLSLVLQRFHESAGGADIMIVEGLVATPDDVLIGTLSAELIRAISAEVILLGDASSGLGEELREQVDFATRFYLGGDRSRVVGCILNHFRPKNHETTAKALQRAKAEYGVQRPALPDLIGLVPENETLRQCRTRDIARHLDADILAAGEIDQRRVKSIHLIARTVPNSMHTFRPGNILVTPSDRDDVLLASCMAALKGIPLAGLVLTGDTPVDGRILALCSPAIATALPILRVKTNSYETAMSLHSMSTEVPSDDLGRIQASMEFVAEHIDAAWIEERSKADRETRLSPAAFCFRLAEMARQAKKRIVLPEGEEPRTIQAAAICAERGLAHSVLLGDPARIAEVAAALEIELPAGVEVVDADAVRARYVDPMVELRKHKSLSPQAAADQLEDNVVLGTMMLSLGEVDGLVSGAIHSSANTVRPALQLIKTKPGVDSVSSIFFMCLPEQVLVYGDCAIIQEPDAPTLASIAIQSADSARQFGIPPRVAMISYSTGESGSGAQVEKVRQATQLVKALRPDLIVDGPLQYDAAVTADVAAKKAPDSPVAGRATVLVFPDLNTGNTTYKAVQRSAQVVSIGPMLQGLRRPVNDLSRGALVEDIVYTIALTAVQAAQD